MSGLFMLTVPYRLDLVSPLQIDLGLSERQFLLAGTVAYLIAAAIAVLPGFLLGARFPTATALSASGVIAFGVLLLLLVNGSGMLMGARVLGGLGAGAAAGGTLALVRRLGRQQNAAAAGVAAAGLLALLIAPVINHAVSSVLGFRLTFLVALPLPFAALFAAVITGVAMQVRRPGPP